MAQEKSVPSNKKPKSSISKGIRFFLSVAIILGLGYVVFNYVPFIAKYDYFVIATGSMEPVIMTHDVVIIDTSVDPDNLSVGDIIAFYTDINGDGTDEIVVHYIYSISEDEGVRTFLTHPEVSEHQDPWTLYDEDIVGIHVLTIPKIGGFLLFAQSFFGRIVLISDILILFLLLELVSDSNKTKKKPDDCQEQETLEKSTNSSSDETEDDSDIHSGN